MTLKTLVEKGCSSLSFCFCFCLYAWGLGDQVPYLGMNFGMPFVEIAKDQGVMFVTGVVELIRAVLISLVNQSEVFQSHMSSWVLAKYRIPRGYKNMNVD